MLSLAHFRPDPVKACRGFQRKHVEWKKADSDALLLESQMDYESHKERRHCGTARVFEVYYRPGPSPGQCSPGKLE